MQNAVSRMDPGGGAVIESPPRRSDLVPHLQEHLLDVLYADRLLTRAKIPAERPSLSRCDLVGFDGVHFGKENLHVANKGARNGW